MDTSHIIIWSRVENIFNCFSNEIKVQVFMIASHYLIKREVVRSYN
jgi:hypothetical protein